MPRELGLDTPHLLPIHNIMCELLPIWGLFGMGFGMEFCMGFSMEFGMGFGKGVGLGFDVGFCMGLSVELCMGFSMGFAWNSDLYE